MTTLELSCPSDGDIWLEYGWLKGAHEYHDMLWYNEGNTAEFDYWYRAMMQKLRANEPKGDMYFLLGVYRQDGMARKDTEIICRDMTNAK